MDIMSRVLIAVFIFMCLYLFWMWFCFGNWVDRRQKTRNPQQRRMYGGSRPQPSLPQAEPTIYVSPSNLPPPPKYEALAPPSYEEVVGIHYPHYQANPIHQPITTPITTALAQGTSSAAPGNVTNTSTEPSTVITVTSDDRRTSVTVATS